MQTFIVPLRPTSLNAERSGHWRTRHGATAAIRTTVQLVASGRTRWGPKLDRPDRFPIRIDAYPVQSGILGDAGNCYPTVKAAIDGLRDAEVLPDDDPRYVTTIALHAPRHPTSGEIEHVRIELHQPEPRRQSETAVEQSETSANRHEPVPSRTDDDRP